jgi:hypothetical protein
MVAADSTQVTATPRLVGPVAPPVPPGDLIPLAPQLYLELPALGTSEDMDYVNSLHRKGFPAFVEIGPDNPVGSILIGPFSEAADRRRIQRRLAATGALAADTTR